MRERLTVLLISTLMSVGVATAAVETPVTEGLLVGLDGSDVTIDGSQVQSWNDQAALGGTQDFYQETSIKRPSLLTDFTMPNGSLHNVLDFNGYNTYLGISSDNNLATNTITTFAVVRANDVTDNSSGYFISTADSNHERRWTMGERGSTKKWIILATNDGGAAKITETTVITQDDWYIVSMTWNGATNGTLDARSLSETNDLVTTATSGATSAVYSHLNTHIGASTFSPASYYFDGQLAEILIYNRVLLSDDIAKIELYLKHKYFRTATVLPPVTDGLLIGLDGSDVSIASEKIKYWNDQIAEGGAANFAQSILDNRPSLLKNFAMPNGTAHNIVDFDGISNYLGIGAHSSLSTNTITSFVVVRANAMEDGNTSYILSTLDNLIRWSTGERSGDNMWFVLTRKTDGNAHIPNLKGISQDQWCIVSMSWDGITGDVYSRSLSQDGDIATDLGTGIFHETVAHTRTRLGSHAESLTYMFDGQLAEVLIYNRALPENEVLSVEEYLQYKYFQSIPLSGTVILIQ